MVDCGGVQKKYLKIGLHRHTNGYHARHNRLNLDPFRMLHAIINLTPP